MAILHFYTFGSCSCAKLLALSNLVSALILLLTLTTSKGAELRSWHRFQIKFSNTKYRQKSMYKTKSLQESLTIRFHHSSYHNLPVSICFLERFFYLKPFLDKIRLFDSVETKSCWEVGLDSLCPNFFFLSVMDANLECLCWGDMGWWALSRSYQLEPPLRPFELFGQER